MPRSPSRSDSAPGSESGLEAARAWLERFGPEATIFAHGDPDGLSAGALLARKAGGGEASFTDPFDPALTHEGPRLVVDQGVRPVAGAGPLMFVDHHAAPEPVAATVVWEETAPSTSMLAWRILGEPADGSWLAALGVMGDLGERGLRRAGVHDGPVAPLRRLTTLCSSAGRLRDGPLRPAFDLLRDADGLPDALRSSGIATLEEARREVESHRRAAGRVAPQVGPGAALIELDVPARVHSQVASAWSRRLAPRPVVVSNRGWRVRTVSFAVRCADPRDLRAWLRGLYTPPPGSGDYGRGHARATGGSLLPEAYAPFAAAVLAAPA